MPLSAHLSGPLSAMSINGLRAMTLCLATVSAGIAHAADRGMSFIGASRASAGDINFAADSLASAGGDVQFALLPFEFNPGDPFANVSTLVHSALPRVTGVLRVTVYVKWFPHDAAGNADQAEFWKAWNADKPSLDQQRIRQGFMSRVAKANDWVAEVRAWAARRGMDDHLGITLVPVLEDTCPASKDDGYQRLINAVIAAQAADGVKTRLRRSCLHENIFRVSGASLELHGPWSLCKSRLQSGDTWCNDGTHYDGTPNGDGTRFTAVQFVSSQRDARSRGVNVMYWDAAYNGSPTGTDYVLRRNWAQRTVNPFTGANKANERQILSKIVTSR